MALLFRSEDMQYVRLTVTNDAAHDTMRELGTFGKFHLIDLTEDNLTQSESFLYFKKRVMSCFHWERKLKHFETEMQTNNVPVPQIGTPLEDIKTADVLTGVEEFLQPIEDELNRNLEFKTSETRELSSLRERLIVLQVCQEEVSQQQAEAKESGGSSRMQRRRSSGLELLPLDSDLSAPFLASHAGAFAASEEKQAGSRFHNYICGTIPVAQQGVFERMLFRVSRGNAYAKFIQQDQLMTDPMSGEDVHKAVFIVVTIGTELERRIIKMCDFFRAIRYEMPGSSEESMRQLRAIEAEIQTKQAVVDQTQHQIEQTLRRLAMDSGTSPLLNWQEALRREKLISDALRMCDAPDTSNMITIEGWVPSDEMNELQARLIEAVRITGAQPAVLQTIEPRALPRDARAPPSYFKTGAVTSTFQGIVNTYGVPRYKEVNPGIFTIVTFPFLFGIMYGDLGHGTLLLLFALTMVLNERKLGVLHSRRQLNEIFGMAYSGRYLLLAMAACAVYAGSIYNDCLSVPIDVFGSTWHFTTDPVTNITAADSVSGVYPYGVDPAWYHTQNELMFFNSLKMKMSVTFGVAQMTFGIILGVFNHIYFKDRISIFFEWIPQLLFMLCTFGYMIFLIVIKMTIDWSQTTQSPPNLIQTMITMFLSPGSVEKSEQLFEGQGPIQGILVLVAFVSVPTMLFMKPCIHRFQHKKKAARRHSVSHDMSRPLLDEEDEEKRAPEPMHSDEHDEHDEEEEEHFDFGEHFIHQAIHTIEFVLGCVSNTASYLRLWALSLAHAELSNVFWEKLIMQYGIQTGSPIMTFVGFSAWAGATFAVLLCMDVLECFLHALRLHWVEFQNKFYHADGYAFVPFSFENKEEE